MRRLEIVIDRTDAPPDEWLVQYDDGEPVGRIYFDGTMSIIQMDGRCFELDMELLPMFCAAHEAIWRRRLVNY